MYRHRLLSQSEIKRLDDIGLPDIGKKVNIGHPESGCNEIVKVSWTMSSDDVSAQCYKQEG